ncbi:MAG: ribonuclease P protein component [Candidatus Gracilibacteria bacterium]|jgi:ribonuclease P protein component
MYAKDFRLKRNQIDYLLNKGSSLSSRIFIARYKENNNDLPRFCVIISRKMSGKAVERNRIKRQITEAIRTSDFLKNPANVDLILIPKKSIIKKSFAEIKTDLESLLQTITNQNGSK